VCAVAEVFECTAITGCKRVAGKDADLPPMVTLNVKEKKLFSGLFGGEGLLASGDVYEDEKVLILTAGEPSRRGPRLWPRIWA
jgi:hypothetical protein